MYAWYNAFIHTCDDSFIHTCDMTHSNTDAQIAFRAPTHLFTDIRHDSFTYTSDMTHSHVDMYMTLSYINVTWTIHTQMLKLPSGLLHTYSYTRDMTHSHIHVSWYIHICTYTCTDAQIALGAPTQLHSRPPHPHSHPNSLSHTLLLSRGKSWCEGLFS